MSGYPHSKVRWPGGWELRGKAAPGGLCRGWGSAANAAPREGHYRSSAGAHGLSRIPSHTRPAHSGDTASTGGRRPRRGASTHRPLLQLPPPQTHVFRVPARAARRRCPGRGGRARRRRPRRNSAGGEGALAGAGARGRGRGRGGGGSSRWSELRGGRGSRPETRRCGRLGAGRPAGPEPCASGPAWFRGRSGRRAGHPLLRPPQDLCSGEGAPAALGSGRSLPGGAGGSRVARPPPLRLGLRLGLPLGRGKRQLFPGIPGARARRAALAGFASGLSGCARLHEFSTDWFPRFGDCSRQRRRSTSPCVRGRAGWRSGRRRSFGIPDLLAAPDSRGSPAGLPPTSLRPRRESVDLVPSAPLGGSVVLEGRWPLRTFLVCCGTWVRAAPPLAMAFTFAAFCYMLSLVLCAALIFFAIWHVSNRQRLLTLFFRPGHPIPGFSELHLTLRERRTGWPAASHLRAGPLAGAVPGQGTVRGIPSPRRARPWCPAAGGGRRERWFPGEGPVLGPGRAAASPPTLLLPATGSEGAAPLSSRQLVK